MGKVSLAIAAALALTALTGSEAKAAAYCAYSGGARGGSYENAATTRGSSALRRSAASAASACATRTIRRYGAIRSSPARTSSAAAPTTERASDPVWRI